jgi:hypothetical protein
MLEVLSVLSFLGTGLELRRVTMKDQVNVILSSFMISALHFPLPAIP